jgi:hypothetical protein
MNEAERIIARFGGIRPMAAKLGIAVTTVQGWKERGTIPQPRHAQILAAAEAEGISLDPAELAAAAGEGTHRSARRTMAPGFQTVDATAEETSETPEDVKAASEPETEKEEAATEEKEEETEREEEVKGVEEVEAEEVARETERPSAPPVSVRTRGGGSSLRATSIGVLAGLIIAAIIGGVGWYLGGAGGNADTKALAGRIATAEQAAASARKQAAAAEAAAKAATEKLAALEGPASAQAERLKTAEAQAAEAATAAEALKADLAALETRLSAAASGEKLQAVGRELADLRARIETLSKTAGAGAGDGASSAAVAENAGKIAANAQGVAANAKALAAAQTRSEALEKGLKAEIARLEEAAQGLTARLTALERQVASTVAGAGRGREASLVAAIGQLREAVRAGRAYKDELDAVRSLAENPPAAAMATLQASAAKGVTEARLLRARFPATAVAVLRAARLSKTSNWIDRALARARSVVVIRRTGPGVKGSGPEAIVARAEVQLDAGDLASAVDTLSALEGEAAKAAKPWLTAARAHIAALAAVRSLHRAALARIGAAKPPAATGGSTGKNGGKDNSGTTAQ